MDKKINILLVEDDLDDVDLFNLALHNVEVEGNKSSQLVDLVAVGNGLEATDYLLKQGSYSDREDGDPDILVLDLNMPLKEVWRF